MTSHSLPTRSRSFWIVLCAILLTVMGLTMLKDWWLTGQQPNVLYNHLVQPVDILGAAGVVALVANLFGQEEVVFRDVLAINIGVSALMQITEIIAKVVYYKVYAYPSLLYAAFTLSLYITLLGYGLIRWTGVRGWMAFALAVTALIGSWLAVVLFTVMTGVAITGA